MTIFRATIFVMPTETDIKALFNWLKQALSDTGQTHLKLKDTDEEKPIYDGANAADAVCECRPRPDGSIALTLHVGWKEAPTHEERSQVIRAIRQCIDKEAADITEELEPGEVDVTRTSQPEGGNGEGANTARRPAQNWRMHPET